MSEDRVKIHKILCIGKLGGNNNQVSLSGKPNWNVPAYSKILLTGLELSLKPGIEIIDGDNTFVVQTSASVTDRVTITVPPGIYTNSTIVSTLTELLALNAGYVGIVVPYSRGQDFQVSLENNKLLVILHTYAIEVQKLVSNWQVVDGDPIVTDLGVYTGVIGALDNMIINNSELPNATSSFTGVVTKPGDFSAQLLSPDVDVLLGVSVRGNGGATATTLNGGGTGYVDTLDVPTTGGTGYGLTVDIVTAVGVITGITINQPGQGYTVADLITVSAGNLDSDFTVDVISDGTYFTTINDTEVDTTIAPVIGDIFMLLRRKTELSIRFISRAGGGAPPTRTAVLDDATWRTFFQDDNAYLSISSNRASVVELTNIRAITSRTTEVQSQLLLEFHSSRLAITLGFPNIGPYNDKAIPASISAEAQIGQFFDIPSVSVVMDAGPFSIQGHTYSSNMTGQQRNVVGNIINPQIDNTVIRYNATLNDPVDLNNANDFRMDTITLTFYNDINDQPLQYIAPPVVSFNIISP